MNNSNNHDAFSRWSEIRCNFYDEQDGFWRVDAWKTNDNDEEGKVIAMIDSVTSRVVYVDKSARIDDYAQEIISKKVNEIQSTGLTVEDEYGVPIVYFQTDIGTLAVSFESKENCDKDSVFVSLRPKNHAGELIDLTGVKILTGDDAHNMSAENSCITLAVFGNPAREDPTETDVILDTDIEDVFNDDEAVGDIVLRPEEYNALQKISSATKMDCWFYLEEHNGLDYIYDLENNRRLSVKDGVSQLYDGMVEPPEDPLYGLTGDEIVAFKQLIKNLGLNK